MIIFEWVKIVLVFLVMISVLVAAHEYGHYLFARIFKMGVEEFAIGFGKKPIWVWMKKTHRIPLTLEEGHFMMEREAKAIETSAPKDGATETEEAEVPEESELVEGTKKVLFAFEGASTSAETLVKDELGVPTALDEETLYTVRPWPLGGFVRIKGMLPEDDGSEVRVPGGFYSKAPWKRFIVLLAGPAFSVLAGVLILFGLFMAAGLDRPMQNIVEQVASDGPARELKRGDVVIAVNGEPVKRSFDIISRIRDHAGETFTFTVKRGAETKEFKIVPRLDPEPTPVLDENLAPTGEMKLQGKLIVFFKPIAVRIPLAEAASISLSKPVEVVGDLVKLVRRQVKVQDSVGGPIAMIGATKNATEAGVYQVILLAAMLSISVGIFNLLPIHPLDGGQMIVALAEMIRGGKRLSIGVQGAVAGLGLAVLMLMVVGVLFLDVNRAVGGSSNADVPSSPRPTIKK